MCDVNRLRVDARRDDADRPAMRTQVSLVPFVSDVGRLGSLVAGPERPPDSGCSADHGTPDLARSLSRARRLPDGG
jgi:hypothetical protein